MPENTTLADKLTSEGDRILSMFGGFSPLQWQMEIYTEGEVWTIRDILSHFVFSERGLLRLFKQIQSGEGGISEDFSIDRYNTSQMNKNRVLDPGDLLDQFQSVRADTVSWVKDLTLSDLDLVGRHPFLGETTLREMIKMLYLHPQIHYRDIKKTMEKAASSPDSASE